MTHTVCSGCNKNWIFNDDKLCGTCSTRAKVKAEIIEVVKQDTDFDTIMDMAVSV